MRGAGAVRCLVSWCALAVAAVIPTRALAFEFFDGRLEIHGFYEAQIRSIATDFHFGSEGDLTQWWNILNFEIEADIAPDGIGPFDLVTGFMRVEVRYDCIWTSACSIFDNTASYAKNSTRSPKRLLNSRRTGYASSGYFRGDTREFTNQENTQPFIRDGFLPDRVPPQPNSTRRYLDEPRKNPTLNRLWNSVVAVGFDGLNDSGDEPGLVYFADYQPLIPGGSPFNYSYDCGRWGSREVSSTAGGFAGDTLPLEPECEIFAIGVNADKPNSSDPRDENFFVPGLRGSGALPFRPAPELAANDWSAGARDVPLSRGLYYPSARLRELLLTEDLDSSVAESSLTRQRLAWNHGQSQENENELKELYFDIEMFDSRLWLRIGFQTIVWGKTELFRNQDQFNPQDLALASLPSLEESRISLWAARGVWSFYEVGPLQDVRVELAINYDRWQPNDLGICGEPYTVLAVCGLRSGTFAHGALGAGLVGAVNPPAAWNGWSGIEVGGRVEWRWDRFAFAVTDFYGYQDFPWIDRLFTYSRNVDPYTGRPREAESRGRCRTGRDHACLTPAEAVSQHHANQQLYQLICAMTLPANIDTDPTACLANIWSSQAPTTQPSGAPGPFVVAAVAGALAGDTADALLLGGAGDYTDKTYAEIDRYVVVDRTDVPLSGFTTVTVPLNRDVADGPVDHPADHPLRDDPEFGARAEFFHIGLGLSLADKLTDQQEALLGCGAFYQTTCDLDGLDLLNAEASAVYSAWPVANGTNGDIFWDTTNKNKAQPGTRGFRGGEPQCLRYQNGQTFILPGCRGPGDRGYDPRVDGTTTGLLHPFTGQQFKSEINAVSWNLMMFLTAASVPPPPAGKPLKPSESNRIAPISERFVPNDPFRKGACSFRHPQLCYSVKGLIDTTGVGPNQIRAGGNGALGRRDYLWHGGGQVVARAQKKNILGFSTDFAEDYTKSNWGIEFTWVSDLIVGDTQSFSGTNTSDFYRLTISVDRPTFVNFLNANRTFFFNTQWFIQYGDDYTKGFTGIGPWNVFFVIAVDTGYFRDRLLPGFQMVYFFDNHSMGFLPRITWRFTENFSATFGAAIFSGRTDSRPGAINPAAPPTTRVGRGAYSSFVDNGLSAVRERDELYLRIRYTF